VEKENIRAGQRTGERWRKQVHELGEGKVGSFISGYEDSAGRTRASGENTWLQDKFA